MIPPGASAFCARYPRLFHVTDPGALDGIRAHGLLSAEALVDLYAVPAAEREELLTHDRGRGHFHPLARQGLPGAVLRDQWMPDERLLTCLTGRFAGRPGAWRRLVNGHVFFWLSDSKAAQMAGLNRNRRQIVLRFDSAALLARHHDAAFTTPINAGFALSLYGRPPARRDESTFRPLSGFPHRDRRPPRELAIRGGVPDAWACRIAEG